MMANELKIYINEITFKNREALRLFVAFTFKQIFIN